MKKFIFIFVSIILYTSCNYIFPQKETKEEIIVYKGNIYSKHSVPTGYTISDGPNAGKADEYLYVTVIDSCGNQKTFRTNYDCYNSVNLEDSVKVVKLKRSLLLKNLFEIKIVKKNE